LVQGPLLPLALALVLVLGLGLGPVRVPQQSLAAVLCLCKRPAGPSP
jgi:uncharacterized protein YjeT (DUF2065 family)